MLDLFPDNSNNFVLHYLRGLQVVIVLCRQIRLQNHIAVVLISVEMGGNVHSLYVTFAHGVFSTNYDLMKKVQPK